MGIFKDVFSTPDKANTDVDPTTGKPLHTRDGTPMSGATPVYERGKPRTGNGPQQSSYQLGNDASYLPGFESQTNQLGTQGQGLAQQASQLGQQYDTLGQQQGKQFYGLAGDAQGRAAPTTAYDPMMYGAQGQNAAAGTAQLGLAQQLAALGGAPQGPSAAQAQLDAGKVAALNSQQALARSGRGFGESATAMAQAGQQASGTVASAANQSAALGAQENQAYRQQQLNDLAASGQQLSASRNANLGLAQQAAQLGQFDTTSAQQQGQLNDAYAQSLYGNQLQSQQLGLQGVQAGYAAQNQGYAQQAGALGLGLQAAQAQQQGGEQYQSDLTNVYGIDRGVQTAYRQLDQQNNNMWTQAGLGATSGLAEAAATYNKNQQSDGTASDRRMKHRIRLAELDEHYRALGGREAA